MAIHDEFYRQKLLELERSMSHEFNGFAVKFKDEGYEGLMWHYRFATWFVDAMYDAIRLFDRSFDRTMMDYVTTYGNEVWFPSRSRYENPSRAYANYKTLRHEKAHLLDRKGFFRALWFSISYVFLLPSLFTVRCFWEMRGYAQNMIVEYEEFGVISQETRDWIVNIMTTGGYAWMIAPFMKRKAIKMVDSMASRIESGDVSGYSLHSNSDE